MSFPQTRDSAQVVPAIDTQIDSTVTADLEFHPIANIFPLMTTEDLSGLSADIKIHGLREPILLHPDGTIIDGRNRYLACRQAGVIPAFSMWNEQGSLASLVWSLNGVRRHLTSSQKAPIAVELLPALEEEARKRQEATSKHAPRDESGHVKPVSQTIDSPEESDDGKAAAEAARITGTNRQYVADAKKLKQCAPDLFAKVQSGELTIPQAKKELRKREQAQQEAEAAKAAKKKRGAARPWALTDDQQVVECQALITDPPYGILEEVWEPDDLVAFTREWAGRWSACGADTIAIFWSQGFLWEGRQLFDEALTGYKFQQLLIWHYRNNMKPSDRMGFKRTWEPAFFYRKIGCDRKITIGGGKWGEDLNDFDCHVAAMPQSNFNAAESKQHPAQKPVSVMRWIVNTLTNPGELVVDPFAGSGTTGIAALQLGRRFHGIEIDPGYRQTAEGRIATYGRQL